MGDAHGRVSGVDGLAARARRAERVHPDLLGIDLHLHLVGLRKDRDGDGGGVDAPLLFGGRDALHAVHAAFILKLAVDLLALNHRNHFLEPAHSRKAS